MTDKVEKQFKFKTYCKRPLEIKAIRVKKLLECAWNKADLLPSELQFEVSTGNLVIEPDLEYIRVGTLEGSMKGFASDWLIKGIENEFYICKDSVFKKTYEKVKGKV